MKMKKEFYRCENDWRLLTDRLIKKGACLGHHVRQPVILTLWERILVLLRVIR